MITSFRSKIQVGYGKSHASFGELLQGRLPDGRDMLVTLPIDMWSVCNLTAIERMGPLVINCDLSKSRQVAEMLLQKLGVNSGWEITISFSRNIPVGKGLSSSTADMLSTVRALQEIFGFLLREKTISEIFSRIEPHDGLMYKSCVVYDHRKGELIKELVYIPDFAIVAIDLGGVVDTVDYNRELQFSEATLAAYSVLLGELERCFHAADDRGIARCATQSTRMHLAMRPDKRREKIFGSYERIGAMGVLNTHSGTCLGMIFPGKLEGAELDELAGRLQSEFGHDVFVTNTLRLLV